jgi:RHS repeat-associated protein
VLAGDTNAFADTTVNIFPGKVTTVASGLGTIGGVTVVGNIAYVATAGAIKTVDVTTGQVGTLVSSSSLVAPADIDSDGTYLYVADPGLGIWKIYRITIATGAISTVIQGASGDNWSSLTLGPDGFLYAARCCNAGVDKIDPSTGARTQNWAQTITVIVNGQPVSKTIGTVIGLAADSQYLWIGCVLSGSIQPSLVRMTFSDPTTGTWYQAPGGAALLGSGQIMSAGNYLYLPWSQQSDGVERFTKRTGGVGLIAGNPVSGDVDGEWNNAKFQQVTGLASDGTNIWVADGGNHELKKITFADTRAREFGAGSSSDGSSPTSMTGDPISAANGNYFESFTDISMPGIGLPFTFTRYYNSLDANPSVGANRFGSVGWTDSFDASIEIDGTQALVYMPTGQVLKFIASSPTGPFTKDRGTFDDLSYSAGVFTLTQPDQTKYHFDSLGRLIDITDRDGHTIGLHWTTSDQSGRVDTITDTVGRQISITYDGLSGLVSRITLPDGRYVEYNTSGCASLCTVYELDADGQARKTTAYTYSASQLKTVNRGLGNIVDNTYDASGRMYQQQTATTTTTYTYSADASSTTTIETRNGHGWTYVFSTDGLQQSVTNPLGQVIVYTNYDTDQNVQTVIGYGNQTWAYTYNSVGAMLTVTPPIASAKLTYTYDGTFKTFPTSFKDGVGNTTHWEYNSANGDLNCEILPTSGSTTCAGAGQADKIVYGYDANHQLHTVTDPNGHANTYNYFGSTSNPQKKGLLQSIVTQQGLTTSFDYNSYLQRATMTTPIALGGTWNYTYDDAGRLLTVTDPLPSHLYGFTTKYTYDPEGNTATETDGDNHVTYHYYLAGGIPCYASPGVSPGASCGSRSGATTYTYDSDGDLFHVTDGDQHVTQYEYFADGEPQKITDALGRIWSFQPKSYTPTNSTLVETLPSSNPHDTVTKTYDAMNRLITVAYSTPQSGQNLDATPTGQYAYNDDSQLCYAATGATSVSCTSSVAGGTKYQYDALSRMISATPNGAAGFTYTYYAGGQIKNQTYPSGSNFSYAYDGDNRFCGLNLSPTPPADCSSGTAMKVNYSALTTANPGKITKDFPDGETVTNVDVAGRVAKITNKYGPSLATLSIFNPDLSAAGFPKTVAVTNNGLASGLTTETQTFTFDPSTGRLSKICYDIALCGSGGSNVTGYSYLYDGAGNITQKKSFGSGASTTNYAYDVANELCWSGPTTNPTCTTSGGTAYTPTPNGDRATAGADSYRYDLAHRLTKATVGGTNYTYTYDPLGNRASDVAGATTTTYDWDTNAPVAQLATATAAGTPTNLFYGDGLQVLRTGGANYFYHFDQTHSAANIVKSNGTLEYSYSYQPYGVFRSNRKNDTGIGANFNRMTFDGEYKDTGTTGFVDLRARMHDPATGSFMTTDRAQTYPDYTFASGNPAMFSDPTGLSTLGDTLWEAFHNPVSSWRAAPTWAKVTAGASLAVAAAAGITACALVTVGVCAGFTFFGLGNTATGAGATGLVCEQLCDDTAAVAERIAQSVPSESALSQTDAYHLAGSYVIDEIAQNGAVFPLKGADDVLRTLVQMPGEVNGIAGRFEWIVDQGGELTHQFFVKGGAINGTPIKP